MKPFLYTLFLSLLLALLVAFINSCKDGDLPFRGTVYNFTVPAGFPQPLRSFSSNPLYVERIELGRHLFYEGALSKDGAFPCASCHQQVAAFTTFEHDRSHGYDHSHTLRNAPALANLAWTPSFNHDSSGLGLKAVSFRHIDHPFEMGGPFIAAVKRLETIPKYPPLFKAAFSSSAISGTRVTEALEQFLLSMVSSNSRYDHMLQGSYTFTPEEQNGYALFQSKCSTCHREPLFTDFSYRNIGLPIDPSLQDEGLKRFTGKNEDLLRFRVPSLRNLASSSYYAHDGRFNTIRSMLNHYRSGVQNSATLDTLVQGGIALTDTEVTELVAFLRTLTDSSYLIDPRYAQPQ